MRRFASLVLAAALVIVSVAPTLAQRERDDRGQRTEAPGRRTAPGQKKKAERNTPARRGERGPARQPARAPSTRRERPPYRGGAPAQHPRTQIMVQRGWPIHRPMPRAYHRPGVVVRVHPAIFLPVMVWTAAVITTPPPRVDMVWENAITLYDEDDWTEFTLDANTRGAALYLNVESGRVQFDWAEVTFANGQAQVVDMRQWTRGPGSYAIMDLPRSRIVDHVRVLARSTSARARVSLSVER